MPSTASSPAAAAAAAPASHHSGHAQEIVLRMLGAVAFVHLLNDLIQSVLPAVYPMLKTEFGLSFTQIGLITLTFQCTASLLQPWIGLYTDRHPKPYLLPIGMCFTLAGIGMLASVHSFPMLLLSAGMIGVGSSTFHPEASRVARMASGGRYGLAQAMFQVGGNAGSALGPLMAALIIIGHGRGHIGWFMLFAVLAICVLYTVSRWYAGHLTLFKLKTGQRHGPQLSRGRVLGSLAVLAMLVFSKFIYMSSLTSYYTFYLIDKFGLQVSTAQMYLFLFLAAVTAGTFFGGPIGDRIGRKRVIWISILGAAPFTLMMPYVSLFWTGVLTVVIGFVIASAFSAIVVYAQELVPGNVGMIAGIFFGLMFGIGGLGAAGMGHIADIAGIAYVYKLCSFLPLLGMLTILLPDIEIKK
ncbi:MFS transporter [Oxalobacteraceae bacterium CAVE-383]|nr:MFS transporter [Oxalobacteraceae bacterium CAVE-383]